MGRGAGIRLRLVASFVAVSLLPISILAFLSYREGGEEAKHSETIGGLAISTIERGVAVVGLLLAVGVALLIGRSIVRPLRRLDDAIGRVERGDLRARVPERGGGELVRLAEGFNRMADGLEREALVRELFGQYVTPELAEKAIKERGWLDGRLVTCTALFADIRDFTGLTETLPPAGLIGVLNRYFERMSSVVVDEGGLVNKFGGDSLLAVFGSPLNPLPDHAVHAVQAALGMLRELAGLNAELRVDGLPEIMFGIGIGTGEVVAGNVGSQRRLEYTVIGDAVNVASRLQTLTKELGEPLLVSEETGHAAGGVCRLAAVGEVDVRGKAEPVRVFRAEALSAEDAVGDPLGGLPAVPRMTQQLDAREDVEPD
ncbi:MAG: adenylate/guanylate cyclase domain-containing protein [Thermoleophilia bacterium]|nr:adenylate/guanylate cyclase domain-containing protein [Thermoleophilia bacterium]